MYPTLSIMLSLLCLELWGVFEAMIPGECIRTIARLGLIALDTLQSFSVSFCTILGLCCIPLTKTSQAATFFAWKTVRTGMF